MLALTNTTSLGSLVSIADLDASSIRSLFETAHALKKNPASFAGSLSGQNAIMLFEKPSLRTRVSFEAGLTRLGAHVMYFDHSANRIGERESVKDYAKNLDRWVDCIIARTFSHAVVEQLALHSDAPVINALTDVEHPCQALADFFTLDETFATIEDNAIAWIGDGNNVCHSLMLTAAILGVPMTVVTPAGFEPDPQMVLKATALASAPITVTTDLQAVAGHAAIYTDTWVSMGEEGTKCTSPFAGYQVNERLMDIASEGVSGGAKFMHCLPAHRGQEVTDQVIDSPASLVYEQAENRMHIQNALVLAMLAG